MKRRLSLPLSLLIVGLLAANLACLVVLFPPTPTPAILPTAVEEVSVTPSESPSATVTVTATPTPEVVAEATADPTQESYQLMLPVVVDDSPLPTPTPTTPAPTDTPEPPRWPEPLAAPGPSTLGLHVVQNNSPLIMEFVRRTKPAVVKAVDDVGWLTDVKRESPETVTIGRLAPTHQDMNGDPAVAARSFVAEQLSRYQLNPGVDYWEGWNEPDPNEQMAWYAAFEAERVRVLAESGFRAAVGGFAAGVPEWDEFLAFLPAIEAAKQYGGILTLHEYGAPTMDYLVGSPLPGQPAYANRGVLALRYRWWYEDILIPRGLAIPLVISEAGIDGILMAGQRTGPDGLGWRDFSGYWGEVGIGGGIDGYIRQLAWYDQQLRADDYVIGFTLFTAGGGDRWRSYDVTDYLPKLAFYIAEQ